MGTSEVELLPCRTSRSVGTVAVPLPSSRPHEQVRVQWLGGKVEVIPWRVRAAVAYVDIFL